MLRELEYQLTLSENEGFVKIEIAGENSEENVKKQYKEVAAIIEKTGAKAMLVDIRALKGRLELGATYDQVRNVPHDIGVKAAIVDINENADFQSFQETTAYNAGRLWRWFTDINEARAWLKNEQSE